MGSFFWICAGNLNQPMSLFRLAARVDDIEISLGQIIDKIDDVFKNIDKEERENIRKREAMDTIFSGEGKHTFWLLGNVNYPESEDSFLSFFRWCGLWTRGDRQGHEWGAAVARSRVTNFIHLISFLSHFFAKFKTLKKLYSWLVCFIFLNNSTEYSSNIETFKSLLWNSPDLLLYFKLSKFISARVFHVFPQKKPPAKLTWKINWTKLKIQTENMHNIL